MLLDTNDSLIKSTIMNKPDYSNYVAHFTNDGKLKGDNNADADIEQMSAYDRLISILRSKTIKASNMPWTGAKAVCFTESPWTSLLVHTQRYSPYGIGFNKKALFVKHGGPAIYIRTDHYRKQCADGGGFHKMLLPFVTPFSPTYRPYSMKNAKYDIGDCDYTHEREWRVPHDFPFEYRDVKFIILNTYQDMAKFPQDLKDAIGREKFILMDNYKIVEELWPVHIK